MRYLYQALPKLGTVNPCRILRARCRNVLMRSRRLVRQENQHALHAQQHCTSRATTSSFTWRVRACAALRPQLSGVSAASQATSSATADAATGLVAPPDAAAAAAAAEPARLDDADALEDALDDMRSAGCKFLGKYDVLGAVQRRSGGQGIVQFMSLPGCSTQVAVKVCRFSLAQRLRVCRRAFVCIVAPQARFHACTLSRAHGSRCAIPQPSEHLGSVRSAART